MPAFSYHNSSVANFLYSCCCAAEKILTKFGQKNRILQRRLDCHIMPINLIQLPPDKIHMTVATLAASLSRDNCRCLVRPRMVLGPLFIKRSGRPPFGGPPFLCLALHTLWHRKARNFGLKAKMHYLSLKSPRLRIGCVIALPVARSVSYYREKI